MFCLSYVLNLLQLVFVVLEFLLRLICGVRNEAHSFRMARIFFNDRIQSLLAVLRLFLANPPSFPCTQNVGILNICISAEN